MELQDAIEQFTLDTEACGLSPTTIRWYRQRLSRLTRFLGEQGFAEVEQVTTADLRAFIVSLREQTIRWADHPYHPPSNSGLSPHTIHGYVRVVRAFFRWLAYEGVIETNPATRIKLPRLPKEPPKAIVPNDRERLLETARPDPRDYAIVCFLADTACRVGGLVGLRLSDLDLKGGCAVVREKGRGGWKTRTAYFNGCTRAALSRWLETRQDVGTDAVFVSKNDGQALTTGGVYQVLKRLAKRGGVEGRFNPHSFRHGWAREALVNGANLADVAQVLGHEDEAVTLRFYSRWTRHELKERHSQFSPLAEGKRGA